MCGEDGVEFADSEAVAVVGGGRSGDDSVGAGIGHCRMRRRGETEKDAREVGEGESNEEDDM